MKIDICAMVDITMAYLSGLDNEFSELGRFVANELSSLGMGRKKVKAEIDKIIELILQMKLSEKRIKAEYIRIVVENSLSGSGEFLSLMEILFEKSNLNSKYLTSKLIAGLILEFYQSKKEVKSVVEANKKVVQKIDNILMEADWIDGDVSKKSSIPKSILSTHQGYPRMALVFAFRLYQNGVRRSECKVLAKSMVSVWVNYGFDYIELKNIYTQKNAFKSNTGEKLTLDVKEQLHCRLEERVYQGFFKQKTFDISNLIELTFYYFEKATLD